ncbi:MAG: hypothetical protein R6V67_12775, partial [Spirochaetia bacterium]
GLTEKEAVKDKLRRGLAARIETGLSGELPAEIEDRVEESALGVLQAMESDGRYDAVLINPYGEADPVWGPALSLPIGGAKDVVENLQRVINAQIETV